MSLQETLATLHEKLATELLKRVSSGEATAAEFAQAINLLKANNVQCNPGVSKNLDQLQERIFRHASSDESLPA